MSVAGAFVVSGQWLEAIASGLREVASSGQAYAAIVAAEDFASDVESEVKGGWLTFDAWRTAAANDIAQARLQVGKLKSKYSASSAASIDRIQWAADAEKIRYLYNLAKITREGYPQDEDTSSLDDLLLGSANSLVSAILEAPAAAVTYVADTAATVVKKVGGAVKTVVTEAGGIAKALAEEASGTVGSLIPWKAVLLGLGVLTFAVAGVVVLHKTGASGSILKAVKP